MRPVLQQLVFALFGGLGAVLGAGAFWGFTVDDAWIVSRVVQHGLAGQGFQFHQGLATDAITPTGFEFWVAGLTQVFGHPTAASAFAVAQWAGVLVTVCSFALACAWAGPQLGALRLAVALFGCAPAFVWSGAGLSTPWVGLLLVAGVGAWSGSRALSCSLMGGAWAWRPELAPFVVATCGVLLVHRSGARQTGARIALSALAPMALLVALPAAVALSRWWRFGSVVPLAVVAKVPSFELGVHYAAVTVVWGGLYGWLLLSPSSTWLRWPLLVHAVSLAFAGGDWMPALRLTAPLYPALLVLWGVHRRAEGGETKRGRWRGLWERWGHFLFAGFVPLSVFLFARIRADLVRVVERRSALVELARPHLTGSNNVAAVDVGWVGLAAPARVTDLGGVTDPRLARIPGSHTDRLLSPGLFSGREVDAWVVLAWRGLPRTHWGSAVYGTDRRLLRQGAAQDMQVVAAVPLAGSQQEYWILRRISLEVGSRK